MPMNVADILAVVKQVTDGAIAAAGLIEGATPAVVGAVNTIIKGGTELVAAARDQIAARGLDRLSGAETYAALDQMQTDLDAAGTPTPRPDRQPE